LRLSHAALTLLSVEDAACKKYYSLLKDLSLLFPRFSQHLQSKAHQSGRGRACVLEFSKTGVEPKIERFDSPLQLRSYLDSLECSEPASEIGLYGRLWMLEDISVNWISVLGSRLLIPPSFFAAQWPDPSGAVYNDRPSFEFNYKRQFLLKYARFQQGTVSTLKGDRSKPSVKWDCNVERHLLYDIKEDDKTYEHHHFARSYHNLSFWSKKPTSGPWDGLYNTLTQPQEGDD
jgi:hypothetical protein